MEVVIHPKSNLKVGDTLRVAVIHENRLDVASMKYVRSAILEHAQQSVQPTAFGAGGRGQNSLQSSFIADESSAKLGGN